MQPPHRGARALRTALLIATLAMLGGIDVTSTAAPAATAPANTAGTPARTPASPPAAGAGAGPAAGAGANDADEAQPPPPPRDTPRRSPDIFVPTEGVPEDRPIAFPVDI